MWYTYAISHFSRTMLKLLLVYPGTPLWRHELANIAHFVLAEGQAYRHEQGSTTQPLKRTGEDSPPGNKTHNPLRIPHTQFPTLSFSSPMHPKPPPKIPKLPRRKHLFIKRLSIPTNTFLLLPSRTHSAICIITTDEEGSHACDFANVGADAEGGGEGAGWHLEVFFFSFGSSSRVAYSTFC